jgi:hypothetical protein
MSEGCCKIGSYSRFARRPDFARKIRWISASCGLFIGFQKLAAKICCIAVELHPEARI